MTISNVNTKELKRAWYEMDMLAGGAVVRSGRPRADIMTRHAEKRISLTYAKKGKISCCNFVISIGHQTWKQFYDDMRKSDCDSSERGKRHSSSFDDDCLRPVSPVNSEDSDMKQPDPFPHPVIARNQELAAKLIWSLLVISCQ